MQFEFLSEVFLRRGGQSFRQCLNNAVTMPEQCRAIARGLPPMGDSIEIAMGQVGDNYTVGMATERAGNGKQVAAGSSEKEVCRKIKTGRLFLPAFISNPDLQLLHSFTIILFPASPYSAFQFLLVPDCSHSCPFVPKRGSEGRRPLYI
jgi:hypothetical protein